MIQKYDEVWWSSVLITSTQMETWFSSHSLLRQSFKNFLKQFYTPMMALEIKRSRHSDSSQFPMTQLSSTFLYLFTSSLNSIIASIHYRFVSFFMLCCIGLWLVVTYNLVWSWQRAAWFLLYLRGLSEEMGSKRTVSKMWETFLMSTEVRHWT